MFSVMLIFFDIILFMFIVFFVSDLWWWYCCFCCWWWCFDSSGWVTSDFVEDDVDVFFIMINVGVYMICGGFGWGFCLWIIVVYGGVYLICCLLGCWVIFMFSFVIGAASDEGVDFMIIGWGFFVICIFMFVMVVLLLFECLCIFGFVIGCGDLLLCEITSGVWVIVFVIAIEIREIVFLMMIGVCEIFFIMIMVVCDIVFVNFCDIVVIVWMI